jgi:hypothetical protein
VPPEDLRIDPGLPAERYARRVVEVLGTHVRLSDLQQYDHTGWPGPKRRMDDLVRLGFASYVWFQGKPLYLLVPPEEKAPRNYRYRVRLAFGPRVFARSALSQMRPAPGVRSLVKPGWAEKILTVDYVAQLPRGWWARLVKEI